MNDSLRRHLPSLLALAAGGVMAGLVVVLVAGAFVDLGPAGSVLAALAAAAISVVALALPGLFMEGRPMGLLALGTGAVVLLLGTALLTMNAVASRAAVERYRRPPRIEKVVEEAPAPAPEAPAATAPGGAAPETTASPAAPGAPESASPSTPARHATPGAGRKE